MNISESELFYLTFLLLLNIIVFVNTKLFTKFIESKPEGRKTVLGEYFMKAMQKVLISAKIKPDSSYQSASLYFGYTFFVI